MQDWRTPASYTAILAGIPASARQELDVIAMEIASVEIDATCPQQWEALASVFAERVAVLPDEDGVVALQLAACMMENAEQMRFRANGGRLN